MSLLWTGSVYGQTALQNPEARSFQSLDGEWAYIVDPYSTGDTDILGNPKSDGYFLDIPANGSADLLEYDFDEAHQISVPGAWTTQVEALTYYEGIVWHRTRFDVDKLEGRRYFLQFEAVNYAATVFLNGVQVGSHQGGFTPFAIDVTDNLVSKGNRLVVKVEAERRADRVPGIRYDWLNYAGITRSVRLIDVPQTFVRHYSVLLGDREGKRIDVKLDADGSEPLDVIFRIPELGIEQSLTLPADGEANFSVEAECITFWSPENPKLYNVEIEYGDDLLRDQIGFRDIQAAGRSLLLNGRPFFMMGISVHDEPLGPNGGRITTKEQADALLDKAQSMGANFVRLAHYPHNEYMLREADRRGLLVWSELPVYWGIDWTNSQTLSSAKTQYSEMVARDINRASIIVWSIANETLNTPERLEFLSALGDHVRGLDQSRLVSAALLPDYSEEAIGQLVETIMKIVRDEPVDEYTILVDDPLGNHIDLVAMNQYYGWYLSRPISLATGVPVGDIRDAVLKLVPKLRFDNAFQKPMILSEFGAGAVKDRRGDPSEIWTEDFQARLYLANVGMLISNPNLQGISPWVLKDFRSPMRPLVGIQDGWNRKGVIDEVGHQKLAYDTLKFAYRAYGTSLEQRLPPAPTCEVTAE